MSDVSRYCVMRSYGGVDDCICRFDSEAEAREYAQQMGDQSPFLIWVDGPKEQIMSEHPGISPELIALAPELAAAVLAHVRWNDDWETPGSDDAFDAACVELNRLAERLRMIGADE